MIRLFASNSVHAMHCLTQSGWAIAIVRTGFGQFLFEQFGIADLKGEFFVESRAERGFQQKIHTRIQQRQQFLLEQRLSGQFGSEQFETEQFGSGQFGSGQFGSGQFETEQFGTEQLSGSAQWSTALDVAGLQTPAWVHRFPGGLDVLTTCLPSVAQAIATGVIQKRLNSDHPIPSGRCRFILAPI